MLRADAVDVALAALVALSALLHVVLCPFAKVEESFNLQAAHDLLLLGPARVAEFDHVAFPGVVPRTFVGALALAALAGPPALVLRLLGARRLALQLLVRALLALVSVAALVLFARSVRRMFGRDAARAFLLLCASQFHLLFYAGRTLPNVFALALVLCAYAAWLEGRWKRVVQLLSFTTIVFRGDTAVLLAPIVLSMLVARPAALLPIVGWGLSASALSLAFTVVVDSYFWQRWLWPEGEVLWFNTVQNKSHEWGVLPPLWYFYSALPRALLATVVLIPFGVSRSGKELRMALNTVPIVDTSVAAFVWPIVVYVALFSFLPHKELRFVFSAIPIFNMAAAVGFAKLYRARNKNILPLLGAAGCVLVTMIGAAFFFMASRVNYPGGEAFEFLHRYAHNESTLARTVHIDVPAAMTGVSRFGEEFYPTWSYSKNESATSLDALRAFDYLLTALPPSTLAADFNVVGEFATFERVNFRAFPPQIQTKNYIFVLKNKKIDSESS